MGTQFWLTIVFAVLVIGLGVLVAAVIGRERNYSCNGWWTSVVYGSICVGAGIALIVLAVFFWEASDYYQADTARISDVVFETE